VLAFSSPMLKKLSIAPLIVVPGYFEFSMLRVTFHILLLKRRPGLHASLITSAVEKRSIRRARIPGTSVFDVASGLRKFLDSERYQRGTGSFCGVK